MNHDDALIGSSHALGSHKCHFTIIALTNSDKESRAFCVSCHMCRLEYTDEVVSDENGDHNDAARSDRHEDGDHGDGDGDHGDGDGDHGDGDGDQRDGDGDHGDGDGDRAMGIGPWPMAHGGSGIGMDMERWAMGDGIVPEILFCS